MTGALTSTPGFSAAKEVAANEGKVTAGYGIGYLFGVLGVVFFVQLLPKILNAGAVFLGQNTPEPLGELYGGALSRAAHLRHCPVLLAPERRELFEEDEHY